MTCTQYRKLQKDKQEINFFYLQKNHTAVNEMVKKNDSSLNTINFKQLIIYINLEKGL